MVYCHGLIGAHEPKAMKHQAAITVSIASLLALTAAGCGLALPTVRTPTRPDGATTSPPDPTTFDTGTVDQARACVLLGAPRTSIHAQLFNLLNDYREANGVGRLRYSRTLEQAADQYAVRLYREDFFDHVAPDGTGPADRAVAAGFCDRYVGENLAYGLNQVSTPEDALDGFIHSPPHNENMLRAQWDYVGIGFLQVTGFQGTEYWWVQLFGTEQSDVAQ